MQNGVSTLQQLETLLQTHFPHTRTLSQVQTAFEDDIAKEGIECGNAHLATAIPLTRDAICTCIANVQALEGWILLALPAMEDGGNFGVSVQMGVLKIMEEAREAWAKAMDEVVKYYDARANALEKLGIEKSTSTTTTTKTQMESTGGKEGVEEEEKKLTTTTVQETKTSGVTPETPLTVLWGYHRVRHVISLDVQMYAMLQMSLRQVLNLYASVLDSVEKNYAKLAFPKGREGASGRGRHMMF